MTGEQPRLERRGGDDRRQEPSESPHPHLSRFFHDFGTPASILTLILFAAQFVTTVTRQAGDALPAERYFADRRADSLTRYFNTRARDEQFIVLQTQMADLKAEIIAERARTDSIIRLLRRSICRSQPESCP